MTDPAISAALDAAAEAARRSLYPGMCRVDACMVSACAEASAAAVAAFLRVLPAHHMRRKLGPNRYDVDGTTAKRLAAAVEEAARDE